MPVAADGIADAVEAEADAEEVEAGAEEVEQADRHRRATTRANAAVHRVTVGPWFSWVRPPAGHGHGIPARRGSRGQSGVGARRYVRQRSSPGVAQAGRRPSSPGSQASPDGSAIRIGAGFGAGAGRAPQLGHGCPSGTRATTATAPSMLSTTWTAAAIACPTASLASNPATGRVSVHCWRPTRTSGGRGTSGSA